MPKAKVGTVKAKSAEISCFAPQAREGFVAGSFNDWSTTANPLERKSDGTWAIKLRLPAGAYEYKFIIDGQWCCKPGFDEYDPALRSEEDCVPNAHGTMNRKLKIG